MVSGSKKKEKMAFAKDKKQAVLAVFVLVLFVGTAINSAIKVYSESQPMTASVPAEKTDEALANPSGIAPDENVAQDANDIFAQTMGLKGEAPQTTEININTPPSAMEGDIEIMTKKKARGKMVTVAVAETGRTNPFLPASENVPRVSLAYLTPPPETLPTNSDAGKVMTTTISGIMYDKYSPSAIINIEGSDYLVKKGDIINHYKILTINKTQVLVQLGKNIYQAGVGELLSQTDINYNTIANLNKKFGGNTIPVNVKRKK